MQGRLYTSESEVCRRQILSYKEIPALKKNYNGRNPHNHDNIGIQKNGKELNKTFMTILNWKKNFGLQDLYSNNPALQGLMLLPVGRSINPCTAVLVK